MWPTPRYGGFGTSEAGAKHGDLEAVVANETDTKGQLNPDWVEKLMGFPAGWTRLDEDG